jgi:hypothetical protein
MRVYAELTLHQLTALFLLVSTVMLATFALLRTLGQQESHERIIPKAVMIGLIYCVAVAAAVYPRRHWKLAKHNAGETRPYLFYVVAASVGIAAAFCVNFIYNYLLEAAVWSRVWENIRLKYPYLIIAGVTAGVTAWSNDNKPKIPEFEKKLRIVEGLVQGVIAALVGWGIHAMLAGNFDKGRLDKENLPPPAVLSVVLASIGFIVGFCVPHWCRKLEQDTGDEVKKKANLDES